MSAIERNRNTMKKFETMINTADTEAAKELIANDASFYTPASPEPLKGGEGYLSIVFWLRSGFSNVQWKMEEIICEEDKCAVRWHLTGTHDGDFLGVKPTNQNIQSTFLNFYYFNKEGKIINDVAGEGLLGILKPLGLSK